MKTHRFNLEVKTTGDANAAEIAVNIAFARRQPDGCEFNLSSHAEFNSLASKIRDIADNLIPEQAEADEVTREQRDAAELLRCLARALERGIFTRSGVLDCFGAPGDFGYSHPIGKELAAAYFNPKP